jgi:RNA polymerase sigma-70 factor (sigma-E family)
VTSVPNSVSERASMGALEEIYVRNSASALRLAYFLTGDRELAEDLTQEAFVRVAGRFRHLRDPDDLPAYLRRTIVNLFTSQLRRKRLERQWLRRRTVQEPISEEVDIETRDELWMAMKLLPERQRAALVLRYYEDLDEREAAQALRCSIGALNQLIVRGKAALREHVQKEEA